MVPEVKVGLEEVKVGLEEVKGAERAARQVS